MNNKQTYDPSKQYKWEENDRIILTGSQFAQINRTISVLFAQPETQKALLLAEANNVLQNLIKDNVEQGYFKEVEQEPEFPKLVQDSTELTASEGDIIAK